MATVTTPSTATDSVIETDAEILARWKAQDEVYAKHEKACKVHDAWRRTACRCQVAAHDECVRLGLIRT